MRPNMFVPWPKFSPWPAGVELGGWRGARVGDRSAVCLSAPGAGGDSPLTRTLIFIPRLRYEAETRR